MSQIKDIVENEGDMDQGNKKLITEMINKMMQNFVQRGFAGLPKKRKKKKKKKKYIDMAEDSPNNSFHESVTESTSYFSSDLAGVDMDREFLVEVNVPTSFVPYSMAEGKFQGDCTRTKVVTKGDMTAEMRHVICVLNEIVYSVSSFYKKIQ